MERKPYPSDVNDEEWSFVAPSLTLMTEEAPQREHDLPETVVGLHLLAFTVLMLHRFALVMAHCP